MAKLQKSLACALAIHLRNYVHEQKSQRCCRIIRLATLAVQLGLLSKYFMSQRDYIKPFPRALRDI